MNSLLTDHFAALSTRGKCLATYIWLGGSGGDLREATKVLSHRPSGPDEVPLWTCDGTATGQEDAVVYLKAVAVHPDPLRGGQHVLVLCSAFSAPTVTDSVSASSPQLHPHPTNNRAPCDRTMRTASTSQPVFSCQQQYSLLEPSTHWPIVGQGAAIGREYAEAHIRACLHAGLRIGGCQAEAAPGQWSYTVGPCGGTELGDHVWLSRYLLLRLSEQFKVIASMDPKPVPGDWAGNGAPVKFSTRETREEGKGWFIIQEHLGRLQQAHVKHIVAYGVGNAKRWASHGRAPPAGSILDFTVGVEDRRASIRIPHAVLLQKRGWYEDRRPASNMDPYLVTMLLASTALGIPLPLSGGEACPSPRRACSGAPSSSAAVTSETISRDSSAILAEIDNLDSFAPDTPPQLPSLLAAECSSEHEPVLAATTTDTSMHV